MTAADSEQGSAMLHLGEHVRADIGPDVGLVIGLDEVGRAKVRWSNGAEESWPLSRLERVGE